MGAIPDFRRNLLVSIRPHYASKILAGHKTVELRRRFPEAAPFGTIALIYSSSPVKAVVGYARIKGVLKLPVSKIWKEHGTAACISKAECDAYFAGLKSGFAIVLESVHAFSTQLRATELWVQFGIVPPQSYRYVTNECVALLSDERVQVSRGHQHRHRTGGSSARSGITC